VQKLRSDLERIALVHHGTEGWSAGGTFLRMLAHSLGAACADVGVELYALLPPHDFSVTGSAPVTRIAIEPPRPLRDALGRRLRPVVGKPHRSSIVRTARRHGISVVLLSATFPDEAYHLRSIGWIPDFQHVHLPGFFVEQELRDRNRAFLELARNAQLLLLNSANAGEDFAAFAPAYAAKARVVPFPSLYAFEPPDPATARAHETFNLPRKFVLVANQFWQHKNHLVMLEAIRRLRDTGVTIPVAMVGLPLETRDPLNRPISDVLQSVARWRLSDEVSVLGLVHRADLTDLLQTAALVVQPSRFEGWSTVVQDCKALGRPLVCSDIDVHREQAPEALGFFPPDSPEALAELLLRHWPTLEPGPDHDAQHRGLVAERAFARQHGERILAVCEEAHTQRKGVS
jgi:glycosyltransferase involved in cell wall biosynthesis